MSVAFHVAQPNSYLEILQLMARYCYHFDRNEPELVGAVFADEATVDYGPEYPAVSGRENIVASIAVGLRERFLATSHHVSNLLVLNETETDATAVLYVYAWHRYRDGAPDGELWGQYHLQLVRQDGCWRIGRLTLRADATRAFHRSAMHPIGRRPVEGA